MPSLSLTSSPDCSQPGPLAHLADASPYADFTPALHDEDLLIRQFEPRLDYLARSLSRYGDFDDLKQAGREAILKCARRYDVSRGVPFNPYVQTRMRGAMLDWLRKEQRQKLPSAMASESSSGATVPSARRSGGGPKLEHPATPSTSATQDQHAFRNNTLTYLLGVAAKHLPPRYVMVLEHRYRDSMTVSESAYRLGVDESRISQMHTRAMVILKDALKLRGVVKVEDLL